MAVPTVPLPRSRWPYAVLALAVAAGAIWWLRGDGGASRARRASPTAARPGDDLRGRIDRMRQGALRRRGAGPLVAPPAAGLVRVSGRVIDALTGEPVPDVEVVFADGASEASATSDLAGRYQLDVRAGTYRPFVRAEGILSVGRAPRDRLPERPRPDEIAATRLEVAPRLAIRENLSGVDLEVTRAGIVRGRVLDRAGKPVAGALVRASARDRNAPRPVLGTDVTETAADGSYQLELAPAPYVVEAFHDGYGALAELPSVDLEAGEREQVDLTMTAGCVVTGRVVRRGGGPPGDGALERAWSPDSADSFFPAGGFGEDGRFRWSTAEEGEIVLRAWPWHATHSPARRFACREGARFDDVVFEIPDVDADLGGTIVTAAGAPARHAYLDITGLSPGTMNQQERADGEGRWGVFALPPGEYEVTAYVEGEGAVTARLTAPARGVTLTLGGTGTLTGRVTGMLDGTFTLSVEECRQRGMWVAAQDRHVVTVRGGLYRIDGLPACDLVIEAATPARRRREGVNLAAGQTVTLDLDLSPPQSRTISGTVRDADGSPVPATIVVMRPGPRGVDQVATEVAGDDGRFSVSARSGDTLMVYGSGGMAELPVDDTSPSGPVDVTLRGPDDGF